MLRFCTPIRDVVTTSYSRLIEMPHTVSQGLVASCRSVYAAIMAVPRFLLLWILVPVHLVQHMVLGICHGVIGAWRFFISIPGRIIRSPVQTYRAVIRGRDWLMAKVEYLQAESRKWRTAFAIVKSPYSLLRSCGLSPQAAMALLFAGSTVGTGVVVNETVFAQKSFSRGDAGVYNAPLDAPIRYEEGNNTLRIDLGTTPVGAITIKDVTVGTAYANSALPAGESNVIVIGGLPATGGFTETYLEVGHLIIDRWRCDQLKLEHIQAYELNIKYNASDGQSIGPVAGVPRARGIGGGNRADAMRTSGGYYDQIKLTAPSSGVHGKVDVLTLSNLYTKGAPCLISRVKVGILDVIYNEVGTGDGLAGKDFIVADTVIYKTFNNVDNVEVAISPPS
jgi:hypothetical protein